MSGTATIRSSISDFNEGKTFLRIKSYCAAHKRGLFSPQSNTGKAVLSLVFALILTVVGLISVFDTDKTVSESENRNLATKPEFSFTALFDKSYTSDFDTYYADTFPFRDKFLALNRKISDILTGTKGSGDIVLVSKQEKDDFAGQDID